GRSRTLMDQLQVARVDPLEGVPEGLRRQEKELRERIATLRLQAQFLPDAPEDDKDQKLRAEFEEAQKQYAAVYRQILEANPVYRGRAAPAFWKPLAALRQKVLSPKVLLLVYHVGQEQSYLLVLGGRPGAAQAFPLKAPAELAERVARREPLPLTAPQS